MNNIGARLLFFLFKKKNFFGKERNEKEAESKKLINLLEKLKSLKI